MKQPAVRRRSQRNEPGHCRKLCIVTDPKPDLATVDHDGFFGDDRERDVQTARA
jgi:hypothetical protein